MQNNQTEHWNSYYDEKRDFGPITSQSLTQILEKVDDTLPKFCLDIGCGTGQLTRELYHRGYSCLGLDISDTAIQLAKNNTVCSNALTYVKVDIENIDPSSLTRKAYSLITCKLVYAFVRDKEALLKRVYQLLESNGSFIIITPLSKEGESKPIAVNFDETMILLQATFRNIDTFEGVNVTYFICHK